MMHATPGQTLFYGTRYVDARAAIDWLEAAFGALAHVVYDAPDGSIMHAELRIAGNIFMLGNTRADDDTIRSPRDVHAATGSFYVALPDATAVDALYERARNAGATITRPPNDTDYGSHDFSAVDCDGHPWTFGTYVPGASHEAPNEP